MKITCRWCVVVTLGLFDLVAFSALGRLSHAGAPIPPYPPPIVGVDRVAVVQTKAWLIYTRDKTFRNDRIFAGDFQ